MLMWLKMPLQVMQLCKLLTHFLLTKTLMMQLKKLTNLPKWLNKCFLNKSQILSDLMLM